MNEFSLRRTWGPNPSYPKVIDYKRPNKDFVVIAGPCSVESRRQIYRVARHVKKQGATHLRGGVFRAGTYPGKNFGWVEEELIRSYYEASRRYGLKNIIEVLDYSELSFKLINQYCDVFQVGARGMQNYALLRKLGKYKKTVFLKRHPGSDIDEWLGAAEHLLTSGVKDLYLIERGSKSIHNDARYTLCLHHVPSVKSICDIPIIIDASHGTGRRDFVSSLTRAGVEAGCDGILVETHPRPEKSISDADQGISLQEFSKLMTRVKKLRRL